MRYSFLLVLLCACAAETTEGPSKTHGDGLPAGGDPTPGDPVFGPVAAEDLCTWFTEIMCGAEQTCCTDSAHKYGDIAECVAAESTDCEIGITPLLTDARTAYDPALGGERLTELRIRAATCDLGVGAWLIDEDGLFGTLLGTVDPGGDCSPTSRSDLAVGLICMGDNVCQLTWDSFGLEFVGVCEAASPLGGDCYTDFECQADMHCTPEDNWTYGGGTCVARLINGSTCDVPGDCLSLHCDPDALECIPATANNTYCLAE